MFFSVVMLRFVATFHFISDALLRRDVKLYIDVLLCGVFVLLK